MTDIAQILSEFESGDPAVVARLLPFVYDELRKLAASHLARENPGHTLDATALVHEVFLKLGGERVFTSKGDFVQAASQAMRRILVDHARAKKAEKRGGGRRIEFEPDHVMAPGAADESTDLEALDLALIRLNDHDPRLAKLVELRRFGGVPLSECAKVLGVSPRTVDNLWSYARAWLAVELRK